MEWQGPDRHRRLSVFPFWLALGSAGLAWSATRLAAPCWRTLTDRFLFVASLALRSARAHLASQHPAVPCALPAHAHPCGPGGSAPEDVDTPRSHLEQGQRHPRGHPGRRGLARGHDGRRELAWSQTRCPRLQLESRCHRDGAVAPSTACEGPLYNSYDDGGFLIWFLPERPVFLDSRQDPYPVDLIRQDIRAQLQADYADTFREHGVRCAFVRSGVPLDARLEADGWLQRYRDPVWTVWEAAPSWPGD